MKKHTNYKGGKNMENEERDNVLELVREFDVTFDTKVASKINLDMTSLIKQLFLDYVEVIYSPSREYKRLRQIAIKKRDKLEETMTDTQKQMLEDYMEKENEQIDEILEQSFVYGFCLANQLRDESIKLYKVDKKK